MSLYQGQKCPVCNEKFTPQDDVVVCPDCGAPHHRACYQENGRCAHQEQHGEGFLWQPEALPGSLPAGQTGQVQCPRCGMTNSAAEQNCRQCGIPLLREKQGEEHPLNQEPFSQQPRPMSPQETYAQKLAAVEVEGIPLKDLITFVRKNPLYFSNMFALLSKRASFPSVNWAALIFNFFYFFYRKMYKYGFIILGILAIFKLPSFILLYKLWPQYLEMMPTFLADFSKVYSFIPDFTGLETLQMLSSIGDYLVLFSSLACGFLANRLYLRHCVGKVRAIREKVNPGTAGYSRYQQELLTQGSTSSKAVVLLAILLVVGFYAVTFLIAGSLVL